MVGHERQMNLKGKLEIVSLTDTGRVRIRNEDTIGSSESLGLAVLADGMGGYRGGEIASAIAVATIMTHVKDSLGAPPGGAGADRDTTSTVYSPESLIVKEAVDKANAAVFQAAESQPQYRGMGTTLVALLMHDNRMTVAHVGDSRAYRLRDGELERVTRDHTLLQELVDRGFYSQADAQVSLNKNLVTRAVGIEVTVLPDLREEEVREGDVYLLCSDGLTDMVGDDVIHLTLTRFGANLGTAATELIKIANENGGKDNISVILIKVLRPFPTPSRWFDRVVDWFD